MRRGKPSQRAGPQSGMIAHDTSVAWRSMPWRFLRYPGLLARCLIVSGMENATVIDRCVVIVKDGAEGYQEQQLPRHACQPSRAGWPRPPA